MAWLQLASSSSCASLCQTLWKLRCYKQRTSWSPHPYRLPLLQTSFPAAWSPGMCLRKGGVADLLRDNAISYYLIISNCYV